MFWWRADTNRILADGNLAIGDPMQSVVDGHLRIELLDQCFTTFFYVRNPFDDEKYLRNPFGQRKKFAEPLCYR
jgi:hypothetical protein